MISIPKRLAETCSKTADRQEWLAALPATLDELQARWSVALHAPIDTEEVSCAWVAPATRADGATMMFKMSFPFMETAHEIQALRFWNGDAAVRVFEADEALNAMLIERCLPGHVLRTLPEPEQDEVLARVLPRLWRAPEPPHVFRPIAEMVAHWSRETLDEAHQWPDPGLVREGLRVFEAMARPAPTDVLLATDLHAGNVLRAAREPWLAIDPNPFVGDRTYDATQHLLNCDARLRADPHGLVRRFADLLEVDAERVRLWLFARTAAESRDDWRDEAPFALARRLAP